MLEYFHLLPFLPIVVEFHTLDYYLLEDVKRIAESAHRMSGKFGGGAHFKLPFHLKSLRSAAGSRRTKLLFLPSGMSKREKNQSRYDNRLFIFHVIFSVLKVSDCFGESFMF